MTTVPDQDVLDEIARMVTQRNFPCVAAVQSFHRKEYLVGQYGGFGEGLSWRGLRADLENFLAQQKSTNSIYLTFWAVYPDAPDYGIDEFEQRLWRELSSLTSQELKSSDWQSTQSDPAQPSFSFELFGEAFFVVGLFANSPRLARRFKYPALVFNVFRQFAQLQRDGTYQAMVDTNRRRDSIFQGDANPMVVAHGEKWESIQFSGRQNSSEWQCPFHFLKESEKP